MLSGSRSVFVRLTLTLRSRLLGLTPARALHPRFRHAILCAALLARAAGLCSFACVFAAARTRDRLQSRRRTCTQPVRELSALTLALVTSPRGFRALRRLHSLVPYALPRCCRLLLFRRVLFCPRTCRKPNSGRDDALRPCFPDRTRDASFSHPRCILLLLAAVRRTPIRVASLPLNTCAFASRQACSFANFYPRTCCAECARAHDRRYSGACAASCLSLFVISSAVMPFRTPDTLRQARTSITAVPWA